MKIYELENIDNIKETLSNFNEYLINKYPTDSLSLFVTAIGDIKISAFVVQKSERQSGVGSAIMTEITQFADKTGSRLILTPGIRDPHRGTTSQSRLVKFYRRFGFVPNQGRNKDYRISELMYRNPKL